MRGFTGRPFGARLAAELVGLVAMLGAGLLAACEPARIGEPGGGPGPGAGGSSGSSGSGGAAGSAAPGTTVISDRSLCKPGELNVGPAPVRRISRLEYNNMVRDLFGDTSRPADQFAGEDKVLAFNSNSLTPVSELASEQYFGAAEKLADGLNLASATGCSVPPDDACAEAYLERIGKRAFRGTFGADERDRLLGLYRSSKTDFGDGETALRVALRSVLVSPRFLYVIEQGEPGPGPVVQLTQSETAARLALYFWRSVPDEQLLAAADSGQLRTAEQVSAQARRLLADPKAQGALEDFALQWLDLERLPSVFKDTSKYAQFTPEVIADYRTETLTFFREFVAANATLPKLFTAPFSFVNARLRGIYGVAGAGSDRFEPVDLDPAQRSGILTQGSVLAMQAHPTKPAPILRGKMVRERVFCQTIDMPPPDVNMNVPEAPPGKTTSDTFRSHVTEETCARCHRLMDPIGFGFSNYNGLGQFVTMENGAPVDARGEVINGSRDLDGQFQGAVELSKRIAASEHVKQCFAIQNFRYSLGRTEANADACSLQGAYDAFAAKDFTMTELMVAIASSDAFRHRRVAPAGGSCQ